MKYMKEINIAVNSGELTAMIHYCTNGNYRNTATLIISHGFMGSMNGGGSSVNFSDSISDLVNVIRFNFSDSEKLSDRVLELKEVVEFAKNNLNKKVILLGRSLGGAASLIVASNDEDILALSLWGTPRNLKKVFVTVLGNKKYDKLINGKAIRFENENTDIVIEPDSILDAYKYDLIELFKKWNSRPILILHGVNDRIVKVSQAQENYKDINSKTKKIVILKKCDHSFKDCDFEVIKATKEWLRSYLK